jgi:hypothetical protein
MEQSKYQITSVKMTRKRRMMTAGEMIGASLRKRRLLRQQLT